MLDKIWASHTVADLGDNTFLIHIDRHIVHEISGAHSFMGLKNAGLEVACPDLTLATVDHLLDTYPGRDDQPLIPHASEFIRQLRLGCADNSITLHDIGDRKQGIAHVISPALGFALPGTILACSDSHTCTVGGVGSFGLGVGSTDSEIILAAQAFVQTKPAAMRIYCSGSLGNGVTAKDLVLFIIGQVSARGGEDCAIEFTGPAIGQLSIEERLTICNMAVELSARTGFVPPDEKTFEYLKGRAYSPKGSDWERAVAHWKTLPSDEDAVFDRYHEFNCDDLAPQVTWGTSPEQVVAIDQPIPAPDQLEDSRRGPGLHRAYKYMDLQPGTAVQGLKITGAFIGSCTNARLTDLVDAAKYLKGRHVAANVMAICTPGSEEVKKQAENAGIAQIFKDSGFEWREPGCSLCMSGGAGGETFEPSSRIISSTNRNFEGRQGRGVKSHLASPATVAWSAILGEISDVRNFQERN